LLVAGRPAAPDPGQDHVAHRQAAVDLGIGEHALTAAGTVARNAVGVSRGLEVELVLNHDRAVPFLALVQLRQQQLEEVVLDRRRFRLAGEDGTEGGRRGAPQRDLLQADQIRFGADDLLGQALGADREVGRFHLADDAAVGFDEFAGRFGFDRGAQVGAEVEVAGHHVDGRAFARLGGGDGGEGHACQRRDQQRQRANSGWCGSVTQVSTHDQNNQP